MAPRGLSAILVINFPICKSQTPTQPLVTVTANPKFWDKLEKKILFKTNHARQNSYQFILPN